jgi:hypothetical protein
VNKVEHAVVVRQISLLFFLSKSHETKRCSKQETYRASDFLSLKDPQFLGWRVASQPLHCLGEAG